MGQQGKEVMLLWTAKNYSSEIRPTPCRQHGVALWRQNKTTNGALRDAAHWLYTRCSLLSNVMPFHGACVNEISRTPKIRWTSLRPFSSSWQRLNRTTCRTLSPNYTQNGQQMSRIHRPINATSTGQAILCRLRQAPKVPGGWGS
jgi:hypothetical protein